MKLTARYDIEAPADRVFAELADFDGWERAAMRRGAEVTRTDNLRAPAAGMTWVAKFRYRHKDRTASIRVDRLERPLHLDLAVQSALTDAGLWVELLELSARRTRMQLSVELKPKTLAAKLYVQSLRLARGRVERNFQTKVGQFVLDLEDRLRHGTSR